MFHSSKFICFSLAFPPLPIKKLTLQIHKENLQLSFYHYLRTLNQETIRRIESFEMWCWRRMLKVKWTEKKTNAEVLKEANVERSLLTSIKKRKHKWLGHIMRHEGLLKDIIEGKMDGKRRKGRPRLGMMSEMGDYSKLKRNAEDRRKWYTMARTFNYV